MKIIHIMIYIFLWCFNCYCMPKRSVLLDYHLRNLSLKLVCKAWFLLYRGFPLADYDYYSQYSPLWLGFKDVVFTHILKPKPIFNYKIVIVDFGLYILNFNCYEKI